MNTLDRFWAKVDVGDADECWPWTAGALIKGYGRFTVHHGTKTPAHRFAYELTVGPIPDGLHLDHLCRNPACVNPAHLEAVTPGENVRRGIGPTAVNAKKTHCPRGHAFTDENTYVDRDGWRRCRTCRRNGRLKGAS